MSVYNHRASTVNLNQLVSNIPVRRKAADQVERDKFEWSQWQSATKAINSVESPAKEKHVRNLILGTFRLEGARLFWSMMTRLQLESHPIVCWKFCYVMHRVLRDGHKHVVNDSVPLAPYFEQLGKSWSNLRQSYGLMTYRYCRLMISKLTFHERNPIFSGNLSIGEKNDIRSLFNDNLDAYFQLCIELLDYMEELLGLVEVVFTSLDQSRANSMTTAGQCRLHPLIMCIQDSSVLYDYIVKVLFKLHDSLPGDTLQGHRQRLIEQFRRLKRFYEQSSTLQYFRDLIKVPILPDSPPNFKLKDDIKNYQPPVAIVHTPPPEQTQTIDDILIDTSEDTRSISSFAIHDDWPPNGHEPDRSKEIADLEQRLLKCDVMLRENRSETDELHRLIASKDTELSTERNHRLQLEEQLRQHLDNQRRVEEMHALEKKSNSEEKFNKLLEAYNKLREEHIVVLRREGEIKKQLANLTQEYTQLKETHKKIDGEFDRIKTDYEQLKMHNHEELNQEIVELRQTNDELQNRISALTNERNDYQTTTITTTERIKQIENAKQSAEDRYKELENEKSLINSQLENEKSDFERKLRETETDRRDLLDKNREHEESLIDLVHEKEELEHRIVDLEAATREWAQKFINVTDNQKLIQTNHINMTNNLKQQYKYSTLTFCINQMHDGIERAKDVELLNCKSGAEYLLSKLRMAVASAKTTQDLWKKQAAGDESTTFPFLNECIALANSMVDIVVHGKATSNLVQDVDQSVILADNCRDVTLQCIDLYSNYQTSSANTDLDKQSNELIRRLNSLIDKTTTLLPKVSDISAEELGDLVEKQLQLTHETIDEAVRQLEAMMAKSREQDTGIKCEVNGQILDSCGKLMQTIKILIIKARDLQKEIAGQGRGTASAREFYTKNHKWTEGLVSAAKNVGVNAKVLIESADHLVGGDGKFEEIIACSQEIAAATAQLVAASNVKADRESKNREALTQASKAVNASTAQVVATAKNCASIIEEKSTMDFSSLSLHQTKRQEMNAQVKVLELEKALEQAKQQLYKLRKQHYQMAGEDAGWDQNAITNLDTANNAHT